MIRQVDMYLTRHDGTTVPVEQLGLSAEEIIVLCAARLIFEGLEAAGYERRKK